jgi:signal transduction histidine kinase
MSRFRSEALPFKPRARMLLLLGDQLIRDSGIAVFELVKNAYDADSPRAIVTMSRVEERVRGRIVVEDSGTGMDWNTVTSVWLEPGTDFRSLQRESLQRTAKYHRLPIGEKGIGRFAAHKLGTVVRLVSRKLGCPEVVVEVDWKTFQGAKYLSTVPVKVWERTPEVFTGDKTGTRIEITDLREAWTRGMVRDLARSITSICSPFDEKGSFRPRLVLTENQDWLEGILDIDKVKEYALFRAHCELGGQKFTYDYKFIPLPAMHRVKARESKVGPQQGLNLKLDKNRTIDLEELEIGKVDLDLFIFDREPKILALGVTDKKGLKEFLDQVGGIRVYRDGIRVYDYGEPGNDWLNLGGRRVNVPTRRISNNLVIGAVSLRLEQSADLVEKTNREGFVDNEAFRAFRDAVSCVIGHIEAERNIDKTRIRNAYSSTRAKEPVLETLTELRSVIEKKRLTGELGGYLDRIESDFLLIRERFLTSASAGLSLSVVIHEVEKGIAELVLAVEAENASQRVKRLAKHIADLVEGFAALIRRSGTSRETASTLIRQANFNTELRLKAHNIRLRPPSDQRDFEVKCSRRLTIATLMNLIDNSIWWLDNKWGEQGSKRIHVAVSDELTGGPAIVVADNGPGFLDPPEYLIEPFISRKPDGMGLGLHLADQVMKAQGGSLEFPEPGDVSLPDGFDGAVVALVFGGAKWLD